MLIVELVQQRRKFKCEHGPILTIPDSFNMKTSNLVLYLKTHNFIIFNFTNLVPEDESMIKLAKFLSDKKFRLIDMYRILNKNNTLEMDREEFIRRMKVNIFKIT